MPHTAALPLNDREAQCAFRSLLDYRKSLTYSAISDSDTVREEIEIADRLIERISLHTFYPVDDFPDATGGDGE